MLLEFTKMHGLGNDFMVVDLISQRAYLDTLTIQRLANRNFGIGFDQLLVVEPPDVPSADFKYRIFNAEITVGQTLNGQGIQISTLADQINHHKVIAQTMHLGKF